MPTSPDVMNYFSGTGNVYIKAVGDADYRHIGNVADIELSHDLEQFEHKTSMDGARSVDLILNKSKKGTIKLTVEEITPENLEIWSLGTLSTNSAGQEQIKGFTRNNFVGAVRITGTNDIGPVYQFDALNVQFTPGESFKFISDNDIEQLVLNGNIALDVNDDFYTITKLSDQATA